MNLTVRTISGILIVLLISACLLRGFQSAFMFFGFLTILSTGEFLHLADRHQGISVSLWAILVSACGYLAVMGLSILLIYGGAAGAVRLIAFCLTAFFVSVIIFFVIELFRKKKTPLLNLSVGLMPVAYIALPFALIPLLGVWCGAVTDSYYNGTLPLVLFVLIWSNDVGAYCIGCTFGHHRLFPRVSPKKTWEGSIGGAVLTVAAVCIMHLLMPAKLDFLPMWAWLAIAILTVVAGTFGDLSESLIKREMGVKDSGRIFPGHGGFLDRFDSTLMAAPATAVFLLIYGCLT